MNKSDSAAVTPSDLTPFLYADVAIERSDMEVTVLSALARQGLDPWREAERLAKLPRSTAADELARTFSAARFPESASLADRLVALLPGAGKTAAPRVGAQEVRPPSTKWMLAAMAAGVLSSFVFASAPKPADTIAPASWFAENGPASPAPGGTRPGSSAAGTTPASGLGDVPPVTPPS